MEFEVVDIFGTPDVGGTPFHIVGGASAPKLAQSEAILVL